MSARLDTEKVTRAMLAGGDAGPVRRSLPVLPSTRQPRPRRTTTINLRRDSQREAEFQRSITTPLNIPEHARPATRGECLEGDLHAVRPCPFVSCKYHLATEVSATSGNIKVNFPGREVWQMRETCALDIADRGEALLDDVAAALNISRQRAEQIEAEAIAKLLARPETAAALRAMLASAQGRGEVAHADDGSGAGSSPEAVDGLGEFAHYRPGWER